MTSLTPEKRPLWRHIEPKIGKKISRDQTGSLQTKQRGSNVVTTWMVFEITLPPRWTSTLLPRDGLMHFALKNDTASTQSPRGIHVITTFSSTWIPRCNTWWPHWKLRGIYVETNVDSTWLPHWKLSEFYVKKYMDSTWLPRWKLCGFYVENHVDFTLKIMWILHG